MSQRYWVMWTYAANYSEKPFPITAESPEKAAEIVRGFMSADFRDKGAVFVFESPPLVANIRGKAVSPDREVH